MHKYLIFFFPWANLLTDLTSMFSVLLRVKLTKYLCYKWTTVITHNFQFYIAFSKMLAFMKEN